MTITRGKMQRNLYNQGGIINAVPREGYFLGKLAKSVKKGVKKIGKGVKKFTKSDLGKAAMLAAIFLKDLKTKRFILAYLYLK